MLCVCSFSACFFVLLCAWSYSIWMTRTLLFSLLLLFPMHSQLICHSQACESFLQTTIETKMKTQAITKQITLSFMNIANQIKLKLGIKHVMPMIMATSLGKHHYIHDQNYVYAKHSPSMAASIERFCHWIDQSWDGMNSLLENSQGEMRFTLHFNAFRSQIHGFFHFPWELLTFTFNNRKFEKVPAQIGMLLS